MLIFLRLHEVCLLVLVLVVDVGVGTGTGTRGVRPGALDTIITTGVTAVTVSIGNAGTVATVA
jgi:hypothetical protein